MAGLLWTLFWVLVLFWIAGLVLGLLGPLIHIVILAAAILFVVNMFRGRTRI